MNYDVSISSDVSLSRILDEMILDGTEFDVIVSFLKGHEKKIRDIYHGSIFVFDLYDLMAHPCRVNDFLMKHMVDLKECDKEFAFASWSEYLMHDGPDALSYTRLWTTVPNSSAIMSRMNKLGWLGLAEDGPISAGELDPIRLIESLVKDERDMRTFVEDSHFARSMFMAQTFLKLSPTAQYMALLSLRLICSRRRPINHCSDEFIGHIVNSLLLQLMALDEIDVLEWSISVLGIRDYTHIASLRNTLLDGIPETIVKKIVDGKDTFEEIVFEMNLFETQFDTRTLFAYLYLYGDNHVQKSMIENRDLVEFFNLPFEWTELALFKNGGKDTPR